jgi:hypothetical protein
VICSTTGPLYRMMPGPDSLDIQPPVAQERLTSAATSAVLIAVWRLVERPGESGETARVPPVGPRGGLIGGQNKLVHDESRRERRVTNDRQYANGEREELGKTNDLPSHGSSTKKDRVRRAAAAPDFAVMRGRGVLPRMLRSCSSHDGIRKSFGNP